MDLGDTLPFIFATRSFMARLLMESRGMSPIFGLIHFSKAHSHVSDVAGAIGLRVRVFDDSSQTFACSRKVTPWLDCTTFSKCSTVSTPLTAMISFALRSRSDADSLPGPETGQIRS